MIVTVEIAINGSKAAIWALITDIEHAAGTISGIQKIEIVDQPPNGLVGLRWRETRLLFGKPATAEKWITEAVENESYQTRADGDGFVFVCTKTLTATATGVTLKEVHESRPLGFKAKLMSLLMSLLFKGVAKKAVMQDLRDVKAAIETRSNSV